MDIAENDKYDPLATTYQTLEIARLNDALKECGVQDTGLRRRICEAYFFHSGYFLDSCWFEEDGARVRPNICFELIDANGRSSGKVYLPDPAVGTMWHEYAHGAAAWLFDEHAEDASEIVTGDVNAP